MKESLPVFLAIAGLLAVLLVPVALKAGDGRERPCGPPMVPPFFAASYDADHDCMLSEDEEKKALEAFMEKYDTDRDGTISRDEDQAVRGDMNRALFDRADRNRDSVLSREEFAAYLEKGPGLPGSGPHGGPFMAKGPCPSR